MEGNSDEASEDSHDEGECGTDSNCDEQEANISGSNLALEEDELVSDDPAKVSVYSYRNH